MIESTTAIFELNEELNKYNPPPESILAKKFRLWHVESLLNQAADLLDRCIVERRELHALEIKKLEKRLELAGVIAENTLLASRIKRNWHFVSSDTHKFIQPSFMAWKKSLREWFEEAVRHTNHPPGPSYEKNMLMLSARSANEKADVEDAERRFRGEADENDRGALLSAYEAQIANGETIKEANSKGGAFSFADEIEAVRQRVIADFQDAYDRLTVVRRGLKIFYGYELPLPSPEDGAEKKVSLLDDCLAWARTALRWLVAYLQYEQMFTLSFSARDLLTDDEWNKIISDLGQSRNAKFEIFLDEKYVTGFHNVRLRGIAGFALGNENCWSASISLPKRALSIQMDQGREVRVVIDQTEMPGCVLGRIEGRKNSREPELAGANSLRNASPFGYENVDDGRIRIAIKQSFRNASVDPSSARDFQFELLFAGVPK